MVGSENGVLTPGYAEHSMTLVYEEMKERLVGVTAEKLTENSCE